VKWESFSCRVRYEAGHGHSASQQNYSQQHQHAPPPCRCPRNMMYHSCDSTEPRQAAISLVDDGYSSFLKGGKGVRDSLSGSCYVEESEAPSTGGSERKRTPRHRHGRRSAILLSGRRPHNLESRMKQCVNGALIADRGSRHRDPPVTFVTHFQNRESQYSWPYKSIYSSLEVEDAGPTQPLAKPRQQTKPGSSSAMT